MMDFRRYRDVIRAAVAKERAKDHDWGWRVSWIGKGSFRVRWGYLDYIGQKEDFRVWCFERHDNVCFAGSLYDGDSFDTHGDGLMVWVGNERWHDTPSVEEGIRMVVRCLARCARSRY